MKRIRVVWEDDVNKFEVEVNKMLSESWIPKYETFVSRVSVNKETAIWAILMEKEIKKQ